MLGHKTSCSLHVFVRGQLVNNETIIDRSIIKAEVSGGKFRVLSRISACLQIGFITVSKYQVNYKTLTLAG